MNLDRTWCDHRANLVALLAWLDTRGDLDAWKPGDYVRFLDEPWHWDAEWMEYQAWLVLVAEDAA